MNEQAARFRADLEALTGGTPEPLGLAVSGGPDSLAFSTETPPADGSDTEAGDR